MLVFLSHPLPLLHAVSLGISSLVNIVISHFNWFLFPSELGSELEVSTAAWLLSLLPDAVALDSGSFILRAPAEAGGQAPDYLYPSLRHHTPDLLTDSQGCTCSDSRGTRLARDALGSTACWEYPKALQMGRLDLIEKVELFCMLSRRMLFRGNFWYDRNTLPWCDPGWYLLAAYFFWARERQLLWLGKEVLSSKKSKRN